MKTPKAIKGLQAWGIGDFSILNQMGGFVNSHYMVSSSLYDTSTSKLF